MAALPNPSHASTYRSIVRVASILVVSIGCLVLGGWILDIDALKTAFPGLPPMVPNTAVSLVLAGVSLWLLGSDVPDRRSRLIGQLCAVVVVLVGVLTLAEYVFGVNLGIDEILFKSTLPLSGTQIPGRPAPETAVNLVLVGLALLWLDARSLRLQWLAQAFVLIAALNAFVALIGYAYGVESLYGLPTLLPYTGMSLYGAVAFLVLCGGILCVHPDQGVMGLVTGEGLGSLLARRMLLAVIGLLLALGFLVLTGERLGLYGPPFTLALLTVSSVILLTILVALAARTLNDADLRRRQALTAEQHLRAQLEAIYQATLAVSGALARAPQVEVDVVLHTIVDEATKMTDATYGALGIGTDAERPFHPWVFSGISPEQAAAIGRFPRPVGLLGTVVSGKHSVRVRNLQSDRRFRGFPAHHPSMHTFLGVPVLYGGQSVGNLYLTEKRGGVEFSPDDQRAVELLAVQVGVALEEARLRVAIETERARLQAVLQFAPSGIVSIDATTEHVTANPAAIRILGHPFVSEAGREQYVRQIYHLDGRPFTVEELHSSRALEGQIVRDEEALVVQPSGRQIQVRASAVPIQDSAGKILGAVVVFQDVTAQKEQERFREEWTSVIAHDLRQPVTIIMGYASLLARESTPYPPPLKAHAEHILASARQLDRLIADLLDVSRIEARRLTLQCQTVDLPVLVRTVVERLAEVGVPFAAGRPVRVEVHEQIPLLEVDPGRIEQVLTNLISNAARYGYPETDILVEVTRRDGEVAVSVTNRGPGLQPEELSRLFTRFYRAGTAREGIKEGLGLGLYISKGLVEAHGGRIWVESIPGQTTTFTFTLPMSKAVPG